MPMVKKIVRLGTSKAVILPSEWVDFQERDKGELTSVLLDFGKDNRLIISADEFEGVKDGNSRESGSIEPVGNEKVNS